MKKKKIFIIIAIIIAALYVFFILIPAKTDIESEKREVVLYFTTDNAMFLAGEKRVVESNNLYKNTVKALIEGPESSLLGKTIPEETELISIDIKDKTVFLNFNRKLQEKHWGGSTGERMTVYSIVNTMAQFEEIDRVQILIDGQEIETLAGHMDLSEPLSANNSVLKRDEK